MLPFGLRRKHKNGGDSVLTPQPSFEPPKIKDLEVGSALKTPTNQAFPSANHTSHRFQYVRHILVPPLGNELWVAPKPLCKYCLKVALWDRKMSRRSSVLRSEALDHQPSYEALIESSEHCTFCKILFIAGRPEWKEERALERCTILMWKKGYGCSEAKLWFERGDESMKIPPVIINDTENVTNSAIWRRQRPSFGERLSDVQLWVNDCFQNHVLCKTSIDIWPRRLVEVGSADGSTLPTLVYTDTLDKGQLQYTTLSHCWGPASNKFRTSTTSSTEHIYLKGIPVDELPLTYHHAIIITRYFNIRYIWIDSLCIVQDDTKDWEEEASNMADIFQGSYLTIAATSSSDSYGGCIFNVCSGDKSEPDVNLFPNFTVGSISKGSSAIMRRTPANPQSIRSSPLYRRGWVLQETVLSPRTVLFDQDQMYWQCRTRITSEDGTMNCDSVTRVGGSDAGAPRAFGWTPHEFDSLERKREFWWTCVEDYSNRHLTYAKDKTAAIAGLVRYYQDRTGDVPLLGLWKGTVWYDLSWGPNNFKYDVRRPPRPPPPSPGLLNFPSWSWLSSKSGVWRGHGGWNEIITLRVIECEVKWTGQPFTSELVSSRLLVSNLVKVPPADMVYNDIYENGYSILDYEMSEEERRGILFLLLHASKSTGGGVGEYYLIILPVPGNSLVYSRVGRGYTHGKRKKDMLYFFHRAEEMVIELV